MKIEISDNDYLLLHKVIVDWLSIQSYLLGMGTPNYQEDECREIEEALDRFQKAYYESITNIVSSDKRC